ncbi:Fe(3+) ABC transporter substrate-binding protein [Parahaliea sp. F7430]|uniref:Fe(3+) ABC transporter substrate-binding protein n=1 Tax=Sediminihaliea albiluteola TaxID=2758564 RepID=A0A7W2TTZ7_9GAMM|nr:Fe(3+) ABC transporter substrate-binding protein [Sediminihaliea albiluteola]MBA6411939.1 Fe(3+) ABC transporter substrate-binding protein [Sediminihaliea albiluteola]
MRFNYQTAGRLASVLLAVFASLALFTPSSYAKTVNVYSARQEALIKPMLDKFSEETGIHVNLITGGGDALLTRLRTEGRNSPADVLLTVDAGRLYRAKEAGVLQAVQSEYLEQAIPAHLRDSEGYWFGLSVRARVIAYASDRVKAEQLSTYEALAEPQWRKRLCVRSSNNIYNQSMVASMLSTQGKEATEHWLKGLLANFARPPQGGDRDQIKAVAAGQCDLALVNSYYYGAMLELGSPEEQAAAQKVALFFPNQDDRGTHINISGAGVTKAAKHVAEATALIEFLARPEAQQWYAETNYEYPASKDIEASSLLKSWGDFKADSVDVTELGRLNPQAVMAMDRAKWK